MRKTIAGNGFARPVRLLVACALSLISVACSFDLARLPSNPHELAQTQFNAHPLQASRNEGKSINSTASALSSWARGLTDDELLKAENKDPKRNHILSTVSAADSGNVPPSERFTVNAIDARLDALLYSIAAQSNYQLQINGELAGRATIRAARNTLPELLQQLSKQAHFSWAIEAPKILIWSGEAYRFSYSVDYLNIQRSTRSSVGLATQVGTINAANSTGDSIANSSRTHIENSSAHDFWSSLEADMTLLIGRDSTNSGIAKDDLFSFSINAEAGLLTLFASPEIHQSVKQYLKRLHSSTQRQVLIEASVVEVTLSDSFEAGIDWQLLAKGLSGISAAQILVGAPSITAESVERLVSPAGLVSMVHQGGDGDLTATLSMLQRFGDVKILSRPRIIALNNQASVLKVVDNRVYFTAKVERSQSDTKSEIVTETEIHTVPIGLVMNVTPQISGDGAVMLNVRPTLSRILGFVNDPNPELALANVSNSVPEIQVREMESMLRVHSGEVAVIGGLMQEAEEFDQSQLPGLGRIPFIKQFFSHRKKTKRQTELLIVLRPTIVDTVVDSTS